MAKLVLSSGGTVLNHYFIEKERLSIGRAEGSDVVIDDPALSLEHAAILTVGDDQIVEDLTSGQGLYVNGVRVARKILQHRDVIELGAFSLCYLNTRSTDADFERTMLIAALPRAPAAARHTDHAVPSARRVRVRFPSGRVKRTGGDRAPEFVELDRVVTTFGKPGEQLAVITRRPHGYFLTHVEGSLLPVVNGESIGREPHRLDDGDLLELAGERLEFCLTPAQQGAEGEQQQAGETG